MGSVRMSFDVNKKKGQQNKDYKRWDVFDVNLTYLQQFWMIVCLPHAKFHARYARTIHLARIGNLKTKLRF